MKLPVLIDTLHADPVTDEMTDWLALSQSDQPTLRCIFLGIASEIKLRIGYLGWAVPAWRGLDGFMLRGTEIGFCRTDIFSSYVRIVHILGAFAKLQKAIISFVMSPSARKEQLGSHWTDFHEILYLSIFRKSVAKIQFSLKSDKNNGYFTWR